MRVQRSAGDGASGSAAERWPWGVSLLLHLGVLGLTGIWVQRQWGAEPPRSSAQPPIEVELHGSAAPATSVERARGAAPSPSTSSSLAVVMGGGEREPRPDTLVLGGGGEREVSVAALNLASSLDEDSRDRDLVTHLTRSQVQRLDTATTRASLDDRRATPNPMEWTLVTTGPGRLELRLPYARHAVPSDGGRVTVPVGGAPPGLPAEPPAEGEATPSAVGVDGARSGQAPGSSSAALALQRQRSASIRLARPLVPQGRAAVPARERGTTRDTVDSRQEVSRAVTALLQSSTPGGRLGSGRGGQAAGSGLGSGATSGQGARSKANGVGPGASEGLASDPRAVTWFRQVVQHLEPYWRDAFPYAAARDGLGGLAVVAFTVRADGSVTGIGLVRPSGVPAFDANLLAAVRRAASYPAPPALLGREVRLNMTFDAVNPPVSREGPGPGGRRP